VPSAVQLPAWLLGGAVGLVRLAWNEPSAQLALLTLFGLAGTLVPGPRRAFRLALCAVALAVPLGLSALLGAHLHARYLGAASLGLVLLAGVALTPSYLRRGQPPRRGSWLPVLAPLPLALALSLLAVAGIRYWAAMGLLRAEEEGTAPPRGLAEGLEGDPWRPLAGYRDSSVCGALELEALAQELAAGLPHGGAVLIPPLRDGRSWHLFGPLAVARPDLRLRELDPTCCPGGPERCAAALPVALAQSGGGAVVVPLDPDGRCRSGVLPDGSEAWVPALRPLLVGEQGLWYGTLAVQAALAQREPCEALGGREPGPPARP
jgi:hypothetical protein